MEITFEDNGTPLKRSKNRRGETCEEQLRRMCKNIADSITEPQETIAKEEFGKLEKRTETASDWMEGTYDIRYLVDREKRCLLYTSDAADE